MTRTALVLLVMLLASSLYLVQVSYESRRVFAQLDRARNEQRQLDTEFKRLDAERQAQATHLRVERVAREKLQMRTASPAVTHYVGEGLAPPPVASAPTAAAGASR